MTGTLLNIGFVLVFILIGAVFAASETALVSLRESQARALAERGRRGKKVAQLHADPNRFLAAVQVGVTLAGFLSAAFGASTLAGDLAPILVRWGLPEGAAGLTALVVVTLIISYFSIVLSELAPKRLALQRAEGLALLVAPALDRLARFSRPLLWLLSKSSDLVVRAVGGDPSAARDTISEEELRDLVVAHQALGGEERRLIGEVFEAGERRLHEVMLPRTEVDFLDASTPVFKAARDVAAKPHSRYPVVRGSQDDVVGFVHVRDLFDPAMAGRSVRVGELARDVLLLPGTVQILPALSEMRRQGQHLAMVLDEYGGTDGIVTLEDLMEELIGEIHDEYDVPEATTRLLRGGDVEVDGLLNSSDFAEQTGIELPEGPYETVAGFLMHELGRVPEVGDTVTALEHTFKITELDGRRVARVLLTPLATDDGSAGDPPPAGEEPDASSAAAVPADGGAHVMEPGRERAPSR
ncbi:MAG: hemolysin family protein [Actinomycetota bacterium]|nr:hemolysin family protein [Actinomycetota bacterium]